MKVESARLDGVKVITRDIFEDKRGWFTEVYNKDRFDFLPEMKQCNISYSGMNVLRGLHYQETLPQGKLVSVIQGSVFDAIVNIDPTHSQFGEWMGIELEPGMSFYVPPFYAHGFYTVTDETLFHYHTTEVFKPGDGKTIAWDSCGIDWPELEGYNIGPFLSKQDKEGEKWMDFVKRVIK